MSRQEEFWNWFVEHEAQLLGFDSEEGQEEILDLLAVELQSVDPDLTFEFGPNEVRREFVISAGGLKRAFPAVTQLVGAAPALDRWMITAFRPRRARLNVVDFRGRRVRPEDVQFSLLQNGGAVGLNLFMPGFEEDDTALKQIGYLLLDEALGEFDVESRLGLIRMLSPTAITAGKRHPLEELAERFDQLVCALEIGSGQQ